MPVLGRPTGAGCFFTGALGLLVGFSLSLSGGFGGCGLFRFIVADGDDGCCLVAAVFVVAVDELGDSAVGVQGEGLRVFLVGTFGGGDISADGVWLVGFLGYCALRAAAESVFGIELEQEKQLQNPYTD